MARRALAAVLLIGLAVTAPAAAGAAASVELAELPKAFDDYAPPSRTEDLPPEGGQGGGTTGGGTTGGGSTGGGDKLTHRHILGNWCSATSNYVIARNNLTVILPSGKPSTYRVVDFDFTPATAVVHWITGENRRVHTTFGRFSKDGKQMVQVAVNRVYRRCDSPRVIALGYAHILGSWCSSRSRYIVARNQLTVVFNGGRRVTYKIDGFRFLEDVVEMVWINAKGNRARTRFGNYSGDRRTMTQLGVDRVYRRC